MRRPRRTGEGFKPAGDTLGRVLQQIDGDGRLAPYRLWAFWDEVVGEQIARRAQPQRVRDGVLVVTVSSHTWMQELQFLKETLRQQLNARLGEPLIRDLHLVSGRVPVRRKPPVPAPAVVQVPVVPKTGSDELDAVLQRIAHGFARRRSEIEARRPARVLPAARPSRGGATR